MKHVVVIGGGIIGLSSAFYLQQSGHKVTVIDKDNFVGNCSYGNMGYVCPSHFVPLATPGIIWQGLKWMFDNRSPFYVQPSLNFSLIDWGMKFMRSATKEKVAAAALPLKEIAVYSQNEYKKWNELPGFDFGFEHKGLLEIFRTEKVAHHAADTVSKGYELGLDIDLLDFDALQLMEPNIKIDALGAIYFKCDSHLFPDKLMACLLQYLRNNNVQLVHDEVKNFEKVNRSVTKVITTKNVHDADEVVIATGSWSRAIAAMLQTKIPLMPGRGYSFTLTDPPDMMRHPAVLVEGRCAITPIEGNKMRYGGTMEIVATNTPPRYQRVEGIVNAVKKFFPEVQLQVPDKKDIWYGYRPTSADGLPYIGRIKKYSNVTIATGHSMLGLSLGAGTGKIVSDIINQQKPGIDINAFAAERFG